MLFQLMTRREQDLGRGITLLGGSAMIMLLTLVLPAVVPIGLGAYGLYRLYSKNFTEAGVSIGLAVVLWLLRGAVGSLLWVVGALMAGLAIFFIIRGLRDPAGDVIE